MEFRCWRHHLHIPGRIPYKFEFDIRDPFYFARLGQEITREEEAEVVQKLIASKTDIVFSIFEGEEYLGQIGLSQIYWPARNGRLGIMLCRHAWGRDVARRAAKSLLDYAFGPAGLHKVWLIVRSDNAKGRYIWSSIGFTEEGLLREEYFVQEKYHDMVRYGLLESDLVSD